MIRYEFRKPEGDTALRLIELSEAWVQENCCNGMVKNDLSDLTETLLVALDDGRIIGYCFGHYYVVERNCSYASAGEQVFSLDELYVLPEYRGQGVGKALFRQMEEKVEEECSCMTLATSTKNYQAILKLYIEELGMTFANAFLYKRTREETPCE